MADLIRLDFACNDPDNGLFAGRVAMIHLPDQLLELTANAWNILSFNGCPRMREEDGSIVLSGKRWPIERSKEWYGNWCWNAYWMKDQTARQFLVWLHGRGLFHCETGETRLYNLWKRREPLPLEPERAEPRALGRLLAKAMVGEGRNAD